MRYETSAKLFIQKPTRSVSIGWYETQARILLGLCVLIALVTIIILLARMGSTNTAAQKTQNILVVTQDGKLTVVSPASYVNFKVVATTKAVTNAPAPTTNSETK